MAKVRRTTAESEGRYPRRGEIFLTTLDPTLGREIRKTRPTVIIQNDTSNRLSVALLNQIRAINKLRLIRRIGAVEAETLELIDEAIKLSLGLIPL